MSTQLQKNRTRFIVLGVLVLCAMVVAGLGPVTGWFGIASATTSTADPAEAPPGPVGEDSPRPSPSPLAIPAPRQKPLGDTEKATEAAEDTIQVLVSANNEILQRADGGTDGLENVATGFVWGELQALATEREQMGLKQVGESIITSTAVRSTDLKASPPTMQIDVCIDSSGVDVVDSVTGKSMKTLLYAPDAPVLNQYGAEFIDGTWKISSHTIPEDSSCPQ